MFVHLVYYNLKILKYTYVLKYKYFYYSHINLFNTVFHKHFSRLPNIYHIL